MFTLIIFYHNLFLLFFFHIRNIYCSNKKYNINNHNRVRGASANSAFLYIFEKKYFFFDYYQEVFE